MKKNDHNTTVQEIKDQVVAFIRERDWEQFHSDPKNTLISLVIESGELLEHFRFTTPEEARACFDSKRQDIEEEVADIFYNLLMFCAENNIDVSSAFAAKMKKNHTKYPAAHFKGKNLKYTDGPLNG